jgi:hypothetical protein
MIILKTKIIIVAGISIIIALIAGIQSIEISSNEAYAEPRSGERHAPPWIKEVAGLWSIGDLSTVKYLNSIEWLIKNEIILVDTASAKPSSDIDGVIADLDKDLSKLDNRLDRLEDKIKDSLEFETVIMADKPCSMGKGFCPGSVPPFVSTFYIKEDLSGVDSIIVNVHATSTAYPSCQLAGFGPESLFTDRFGITCDSHPGEGAVLVYTMLKNPSGDGALLEGIDRAGPLVPPVSEVLD